MDINLHQAPPRFCSQGGRKDPTEAKGPFVMGGDQEARVRWRLARHFPISPTTSEGSPCPCSCAARLAE